MKEYVVRSHKVYAKLLILFRFSGMITTNDLQSCKELPLFEIQIVQDQCKVLMMLFFSSCFFAINNIRRKVCGVHV